MSPKTADILKKLRTGAIIAGTTGALGYGSVKGAYNFTEAEHRKVKRMMEERNKTYRALAKKSSLLGYGAAGVSGLVGGAYLAHNKDRTNNVIQTKAEVDEALMRDQAASNRIGIESIQHRLRAEDSLINYKRRQRSYNEINRQDRTY